MAKRKAAKKLVVAHGHGANYGAYLTDARPGQPIRQMANAIKIGLAFAGFEGACGAFLEAARKGAQHLNYSDQSKFLARSLPLLQSRDREKIDVVEVLNWVSLSHSGSVADWKREPLSRLLILKDLRNAVFHSPLIQMVQYSDGSYNNVGSKAKLIGRLKEISIWKGAFKAEGLLGQLDGAFNAEGAVEWANDTVVDAAETIASWLPEDGSQIEYLRHTFDLRVWTGGAA